jgi:hypothetical protein
MLLCLQRMVSPPLLEVAVACFKSGVPTSALARTVNPIVNAVLKFLTLRYGAPLADRH